jgi:peptidyl-prolyl cis-trans isomerase C
MSDKRNAVSSLTIAGLVLALSLGAARAADKAPAAAPAAPAAPADKPLVSVNGTVLTTEDLRNFASSVSSARGQPLPAQEMMNTLIDRELLYQAAVAKGYDKQPEVLRELDMEKHSLLANYLVKQVLSAQPVTDQELRKVYQDRVLSQKINEYKARHILVKTEGEAKDIIAQLDKGADFSTLAKSKSIDTASAERGGDLGWFSSRQMVPEFSKAVAALQKGKYTKTPVKSQFGWHVIALDDVRPVKPPKFEDIKNQLASVVENERLTDFISDLRKKAKIETKVGTK